MTPTRKYAVSCCVSGIVWGCIVGALAHRSIPRAIWGGILVSPAIGLLLGVATQRWHRLPRHWRIVAALLSVYAGAVLFGLAVGIYDWWFGGIHGRIPFAVVQQSVLAFLWGLTFTGYVLLFWPLAYLNLWWLGPLSGTGQPTVKE